MARTYAQLGLLAEAQTQDPRTLEWNIRVRHPVRPVPSPMGGTEPTALVRLTRQLGMPAPQAAWQQITCQPAPQAVRNYVTSYHDEDAT